MLKFYICKFFEEIMDEAKSETMCKKHPKVSSTNAGNQRIEKIKPLGWWATPEKWTLKTSRINTVGPSSKGKGWNGGDWPPK